MDYRRLVGCSVVDVEERLVASGVPVRRVRVDGYPMVVTRDHRPDRVNLTVEGGVVVGVRMG
jgi:hypothetical protein